MAVMRRLVLALVIGATACGGSVVGSMRFKNQDPVWRVNDRADVPNKPAERKYARTLYHVDGYLVRRATRAMEMTKPHRARNVNALDEVPDSTWFTNRIGVRDLTVDEVRLGPNDADGPENHKPWTIVGSKVGGTAVGFLMKDARGTKFLLKFDDKRGPEMETSTDVIVARLLWACGYNVPEDDIVYFRREDLVVADDASIKDVFGNKSEMTVQDLEDGLAKVAIGEDGKYRGLASKYLSGIPIGPFAREGPREDDPNDVIPHEDRRELRGAYALFSWLNHTDLQEDNTLDMWHEDAATGHHYVVHYLIDFGKALGVMSHLNKWKWPGYSMRVDFGLAFGSLLSLGLWKRPFEDLELSGLRGVGILDVEHYHPGDWEPNSAYWPLLDKDRFDAFWGSKILIRLSEDHIRAAIEAGKLTDPKSVDALTRILVGRQRKTARYWFRKVAPLDRFAIENGALCFDDLTAKYELEDVAGTAYVAEAFDRSGASFGAVNVRGASSGRACSDAIAADSYVIVRIITRRTSGELPATQVHLARDGGGDGGALRVIGIRRE